MSWYPTAAAEEAANRRALRRAGGCVALEMRGDGIGAEGYGARFVGRVSCDDGWAAARYLLALAEEDARTAGARAIAGWLRRLHPSDDDFARALHAFVKKNVRFVREKGEVFQNGGFTLRIGYGDCDDHFRLLHAIARAGGLPSALALLHHGEDAPPEMKGPSHAVAVLGLPNGWEWAETTVGAQLGEHPFDAAIRLGLLQARGDLAREVRFMTEEKDLAPVPAGFASRTTPEQFQRDVQALERLGFHAGEVTSPTDLPFRLATAAFQREDGGLTVDGLFGRATRARVAELLPPDEFGMGYLGDAAAPTEPVLTKRLSAEFLRGVVAMTERMRARGAKVTALDFLKVWNAESGIDSHRPNGQGAPFGGLNQMGEQERRAAGFLGSFADWLALDEATQLPFVERYYDNAIAGGAGGNYGVLTDAASLYLVNFTPAFISHAGEPDFVLFHRNPASPSPTAGEDEWKPWRDAHKSDAYAWNRSFDRRKDGTIRVRDLGAVVEGAAAGRAAFFAELAARLGTIDGGSSGGGGLAGVVALALVGAGALAATYFAVRS